MRKRGFIRALWGIHDQSNRITKRRFRVDRNISNVIENEYTEPFKVFVMGTDNYKSMVDLGMDCELVTDDPAPFDLVKHQYRHKLEIIRFAMEERGYDELVYLDWDCIPQRKLSSNFWQELGKKEAFQANLQMYHRRKAIWRNEEVRKVPNGGFIYLRDKSYPSRAISLWESLGKGDNDEPAWAKLTDELSGGWQGVEYYWDRFEPMFCNLHRSSPYSKEMLDSKDICFLHYQGGR